MKIRTIKEERVNNIKMLVYGESGAGKTSLAKTLEGKTLIISSEAGLLCLKDAENQIDVLDLTLDDNDNVVPKEKRIKRLGQIYQFINKEEIRNNYDNIFIDSLTEISQNMIESLYEEFPERKDSLVMYSENSKRMRSLIKSFRDLPHFNVIFTALPSIEKDDNNKRFTTISLVGKVSSTIAGFFDEVLYLDTFENGEGKIERKLLTQKTNSLICKDRSGKLNRFEPADLSIVINKIKEN